MFRRYLFLGLTLMLGAVLVYLIVQSRRSELEAAKKRTTGTVVESPVSATRAIAPGDLVVENCGITLTPSAAARRGFNAGVDIRIRNAGPAAYQNLMLRISLINRSNDAIDTRQRLLRESVNPNAIFSAALIPLDDVPRATSGCRAEVVYADLGQSGENSTAK